MPALSRGFSRRVSPTALFDYPWRLLTFVAMTAMQAVTVPMVSMKNCELTWLNYRLRPLVLPIVINCDFVKLVADFVRLGRAAGASAE